MAIGGERRLAGGAPIDVRVPHRHAHVLGTLHNATAADACAAIDAALREFCNFEMKKTRRLSFNPVYAVELEPEVTPEAKRWSAAQAHHFMACTKDDPLGLVFRIVLLGRHSAASLARDAAVDPEIRRRALGHADAVMTSHDTHIEAGAHKAAAEAVAKLVEGAS